MNNTFLGYPNSKIIEFLQRKYDDRTNVPDSKWTAHIVLTDEENIVKYDDNIVLEYQEKFKDDEIFSTSDKKIGMIYTNKSKKLIFNSSESDIYGSWELIKEPDIYNKQKIINLEKISPKLGHYFLTINAVWSKN